MAVNTQRQKLNSIRALEQCGQLKRYASTTIKKKKNVKPVLPHCEWKISRHQRGYTSYKHGIFMAPGPWTRGLLAWHPYKTNSSKQTQTSCLSLLGRFYMAKQQKSDIVAFSNESFSDGKSVQGHTHTNESKRKSAEGVQTSERGRRGIHEQEKDEKTGWAWCFEERRAEQVPGLSTVIIRPYWMKECMKVWFSFLHTIIFFWKYFFRALIAFISDRTVEERWGRIGTSVASLA